MNKNKTYKISLFQQNCRAYSQIAGCLLKKRFLSSILGKKWPGTILCKKKVYENATLERKKLKQLSGLSTSNFKLQDLATIKTKSK